MTQLCFSPVAGRRVGPIRSCQHHLPRLHGHRDIRLRPQGDEGYLERQDPYGVSQAFRIARPSHS